MADSTEFHGELSGEPKGISELSPDPERDVINIPRQPPVNSQNGMTSNAGTSRPEDPDMRPNLDLNERNGTDNRGTQGSDRTHVMSFMNYDANSQGPVR